LTAELLAVARKLGKRHWLEDNALLVELTANAINHQPESERDAKYLEEFDQFYLHWPTWVPFHASKIAEALAERGDQAAALQFLEKASKAQDQTGAYWMASEILHLEARLALMAGDNETAITKLRLAIDTAQRQEAHFFLLKALTTLLGAFPDGGPVADARQLFVKTLVPMRAYVDNVHVQAALGLEANWIEV
jgi:tetratricopeptide (TPR) repeat protein